MVRDIGDGFYLLTERAFRAFESADLDKFQFELERRLRELRSEPAPTEDLAATQLRNRKLQRLRAAQMMLGAYRARMKK